MSDAAHLSFDGDVVVVTGSARGLGRAYATHLVGCGARVVVNDIDAAPLDEVAAGLGPSAVAVAADVSTRAGAGATIAAALDAYGRVDAVIANAGTSWHRPFHEIDDDDLSAMWRTHLLGTFHVVRAAWPHFVRRSHGRVVTTASGAVFGFAGRAHYGAAKGAVLGLTNTLAVEGEPHGITANTVLPHGATRLARPGSDAPDPALAAPAVAWLCHRSCRETRQIFTVAGATMRRVRFGPGEDVDRP